MLLNQTKWWFNQENGDLTNQSDDLTKKKCDLTNQSGDLTKKMVT